MPKAQNDAVPKIDVTAERQPRYDTVSISLPKDYTSNPGTGFDDPRYTFNGTLIPPSERRGNYTKEDALFDEYMKQYRIDARLENGEFVLNEGSVVNLRLPSSITAKEL